GDHSLTRHDDGEDDGGGYSSTLVKTGSGGFDCDSAGGAHVSISNSGSVRFEANGVIDPNNAKPVDDPDCGLTIMSSALGSFIFPITLTGGSGETSGSLPLTPGQMPDIQNV